MKSYETTWSIRAMDKLTGNTTKNERIVFTTSKYYQGGDKGKIQVKSHNISVDDTDDSLKEFLSERVGTIQTDSERYVYNALNQADIPFENQVYFYIHGKQYFLDFYLPKANIAVEVDGTYHYKRKRYDRSRDKVFKAIGIKTIRLSNDSVSYIDIVTCICIDVLEKYFNDRVKVARTTENIKRAEACLRGEDDILLTQAPPIPVVLIE